MNVSITTLNGERKTLGNVRRPELLLRRIETEYGLTIDHYDLYDEPTGEHVTKSLSVLKATSCDNLVIVKSDKPIRITDDNIIITWDNTWDLNKMVRVFGKIVDWDVSFVTNMDRAFFSADQFNEPIGCWDVSSVVSMRMMFAGAERFN